MPSRSISSSESRYRLTVEASKRVEKLTTIFGVPQEEIINRALELIERQIPETNGESVSQLRAGIQELKQADEKLRSVAQDLIVEVNRLERTTAVFALTRLVNHN